MDPERANDILRYAIGVLKGQNIVATKKGRLEVALVLKRDLARLDAWWQVKILEYWIHRFQGGQLNG